MSVSMQTPPLGGFKIFPSTHIHTFPPLGVDYFSLQTFHKPYDFIYAKNNFFLSLIYSCKIQQTLGSIVRQVLNLAGGRHSMSLSSPGALHTTELIHDLFK